MSAPHSVRARLEISMPESRGPMIGRPGDELNGAECRLLRASLCLERRHIAGVASAVWGEGELATVQQVTSWERSKRSGYPERLAALLQSVSLGVDALVLIIVGTVEDQEGAHVLRRPPREDAEGVLRPYAGGEALKDEDLRVARSKAGFTGQAADLWDVLVDAAMVRAAQAFGPGAVVRVGSRRDE